MLKLKLKRMGAPKKPYYRIVAADDSSRRDGAYLDRIGSYDPTSAKDQLIIDEQKALDYLKQGAVPTETVKSLLQKQGIWKKFNS